MKIKCLTNALFKKISFAKDISSLKDFNSSLSNVYLYVKKNFLYILSTNMDLFYKTKIEVEVEREGSCLVHSHKFYSILKNLENLEIEVKIEGNFLIIKSLDKEVKRKYNIYISDSDEFPLNENDVLKKEWFDSEKSVNFSLHNNFLAKIIKKTIYIAVKDDSRAFLNGILLEKKDKIWYYVATDGKRLSLVENSTDNLNVEQFKIIVPYKTLHEVIKIIKTGTLSQDNTQIILSEKKDKILFILDDIELLSVVILGDYPDYTKVIPKDPKHMILIDRLHFMNSIHSLSIMADSSLMRIIFDFKYKSLKLTTESEEFGSSEDILDIKRIKGDNDFKIAFNYISMLDLLKEVESETLEIHISNEKSPTLFKGVDDMDFFFVVAPMKLD